MEEGREGGSKFADVFAKGHICNYLNGLKRPPGFFNTGYNEAPIAFTGSSTGQISLLHFSKACIPSQLHRAVQSQCKMCHNESKTEHHMYI